MLQDKLRKEEEMQGYSWRKKKGQGMAERQDASIKSKGAEESVSLWD